MSTHILNEDEKIFAAMTIAFTIMALAYIDIENPPDPPDDEFQEMLENDFVADLDNVAIGSAFGAERRDV